MPVPLHEQGDQGPGGGVSDFEGAEVGVVALAPLTLIGGPIEREDDEDWRSI